MTPFEVPELRNMLLKSRKNEMLRDVYKRKYDTVVDDIKYHQYLARYCARLSFSEEDNIIQCRECGIIWDFDGGARRYPGRLRRQGSGS